MSSDAKPNTETNSSEKHDLRIGVHVLTEFVFCSRAGLIADLEQDTDPGEDLDEVPPLDYLPDFSVQLIEESLQQVWNSIWCLVVSAPILVLAECLIVIWLDWWLAIVPALIAILGVRRFVADIRNVGELSRRLRLAHDATSCEPDPNSPEMQQVNWWELQKAGFVAVRYDAPHEDNEIGLVGRPWRVLQKGSLRIPVFLKRHGEPRVFDQHIVRMAAYCQLLVTAEGGEAPYGIVLFADTYDGVTVPITDDTKESLENAVNTTKSQIQSSASTGVAPDTPARTHCKQCPLGKPRLHNPGLSDTRVGSQPLSAYLTRGVDQRLYHSTCGDHFRWVPPHQRARELRLL